MKWIRSKLGIFRRHDLYYPINAYLIFSILIFWIYFHENLFLSLNQSLFFPVLFLDYILLILNLYLFRERVYKFDHTVVFTILFSLNMVISLFKIQSIFILIGFSLLILMVYNKLNQDKNNLRLIPLLLLGLFLLKGSRLLLTQTNLDLGKFVFKGEEIDYRLITCLFSSLVLTLISIGFSKYLQISWPKLWQKLQIQDFRKVIVSLILSLAIGVTIYIAILLYAKEATLSLATYDKGLFAQMFANMARGLGPITTLERDRVLSHFAVHVSPIFYLMLPVYLLGPSPETLEVLQVLIVMSGIIPFILILRELKLSNWMKSILPLIYIFAPLLTTSHSFGLHENCFLPPLLLWLIYANLKQWQWPLLALSLLVSMIKEDAVIYIVSLGLYFLLQNRRPLRTRQKTMVFFSQILQPILYFIVCLYWLNKYGDGAMTDRFVNFMLPNQKGLLPVIQNIFMNPFYTLANFFIQRKLIYILVVLASQAFLPIFQKDWETYLLLIPMLVINLLSDYIYQVSFSYQYNYGTSTLLLFMTLLALEGLHEPLNFYDTKISPSWTQVVFAIIMSVSIWTFKTNDMANEWRALRENPQSYQEIKDTLASLPSEKIVLTQNYLTSHLTDHRQLYDILYHHGKEVDLEIDLLVFYRHIMDGDSQMKEVILKYIEAGYQESAYGTDRIQVLERPE